MLWYTKAALQWPEMRSIDFVNIITSRHFEWLFLIEIGATLEHVLYTHAQNIRNAILTPFIAIMISGDLIMFQISIHFKAKHKYSLDLNHFEVFFSPPFFFWTSWPYCCFCHCCRRHRISLQIPTYYGFNNAGHYLIVYILFVQSKI